MSLFSQITGINANQIKQFLGVSDEIEKEDNFDYSAVDYTVGDDTMQADNAYQTAYNSDDALFDYNKNKDDDDNISEFNFEG